MTIRQSARDAIETLQDRSTLLQGRSRQLADAMFSGESAASDLSDTFGVTGRTVQRRWGKLKQSLANPLVAVLHKSPQIIPEDHQEIARLRFVDGLSIRQIAVATGSPQHAIRSKVEGLNLLHRVFDLLGH